MDEMLFEILLFLVAFGYFFVIKDIKSIYIK